MADSAGLHAYGGSVSLATTVNGTYTAIGELVDVDPGKLKINAAAATYIASAGAATEKKPAMIDAQPVKLTINYVQTQWNTIFGYARTVVFMKIILPKTASQSVAGDTFLFEGFFTEIPMGPDKLDPLDTKVMQSTFEFTVTGLPTFTAGS